MLGTRDQEAATVKQALERQLWIVQVSPGSGLALVLLAQLQQSRWPSLHCDWESLESFGAVTQLQEDSRPRSINAG